MALLWQLWLTSSSVPEQNLLMISIHKFLLTMYNIVLFLKHDNDCIVLYLISLEYYSTFSSVPICTLCLSLIFLKFVINVFIKREFIRGNAVTIPFQKTHLGICNNEFQKAQFPNFPHKPLTCVFPDDCSMVYPGFRG